MMTTKAPRPSGQMSPRWAFWARFTIPCRNGIPYLARLRIVQTPFFGIYLHDIYEPDGDRDSHNHPWPFVSIILRGEYTERYYPDPEGEPEKYVLRRWPRFSAHRMGRSGSHRITDAAPGLKTLILTGRRAKEGWGFFVDGEYVRWQDYIEKEKAA